MQEKYGKKAVVYQINLASIFYDNYWFLKTKLT